MANWHASNSLETLLDMRRVFGSTSVAVTSTMIIHGVFRFLFSALWAHCLVLEVWSFVNHPGMSSEGTAETLIHPTDSLPDGY